MDRRAHWLLRGAAVAVLVVETVLPRSVPAAAPANAPADAQVVPAPAAPSAPVAMN